VRSIQITGRRARALHLRSITGPGTGTDRQSAQDVGQQPVDLGLEPGRGLTRRGRVGTDDQVGSARQLLEAGSHEGAHYAFGPVPRHGPPYGFGYDEPDPCWPTRPTRVERSADDQQPTATASPVAGRATPQYGGEVAPVAEPGSCGQHRQQSGREFGAALGPAGGQDGASGTGAHPQPEAMSLGPATVVRLEGALAHEVSDTADDGERPAGGSPGGGSRRHSTCTPRTIPARVCRAPLTTVGWHDERACDGRCSAYVGACAAVNRPTIHPGHAARITGRRGVPFRPIRARRRLGFRNGSGRRLWEPPGLAATAVPLLTSPILPASDISCTACG